jgi:hypothetical protein
VRFQFVFGLLLFCTNFFANGASAQTALTQDKAYLTIQDRASSARSSFQSPETMIQGGLEVFATTGRIEAFDLLKWVQHKPAAAVVAEPYDRKKHFGTWINDPTDDNCYNTRAQILIRDSQAPVQFKPSNPCSVEAGVWKDPYSAQEFKAADEIQIDHMVPLKNAYISGAWKWNAPKRCLYANFRANDFHLLAVSNHENMSKGDNSPDEYLPSNQKHICQYLENWLKIKLIWALEMSPAEGKAIQENIQQYGCDPKRFQMTDSELSKERTATIDLQIICAGAAAGSGSSSGSSKGLE